MTDLLEPPTDAAEDPIAAAEARLAEVEAEAERLALEQSIAARSQGNGPEMRTRVDDLLRELQVAQVAVVEARERARRHDLANLDRRGAQKLAKQLGERVAGLAARLDGLDAEFAAAASLGDVDAIIGATRARTDLPVELAAVRLAAATLHAQLCEAEAADVEAAARAAADELRPLRESVETLKKRRVGLLEHRGGRLRYAEQRSALLELDAELDAATNALAVAEHEQLRPQQARLHALQGERLRWLEVVRDQWRFFTPHSAPVVRSLLHSS